MLPSIFYNILYIIHVGFFWYIYWNWERLKWPQYPLEDYPSCFLIRFFFSFLGLQESQGMSSFHCLLLILVMHIVCWKCVFFFFFFVHHYDYGSLIFLKKVFAYSYFSFTLWKYVPSLFSLFLNWKYYKTFYSSLSWILK